MAASSVTSGNYIYEGIYDGLFPDFDPNYGEAELGIAPSMRPAEALNYAKVYFQEAGSFGSLKDIQRLQNIYHWFGDPEMELRDETPGTLAATLPETFPQTAPEDVVISVTKNGDAISGAVVAISLAGTDFVVSAATNIKGVATFENLQLERPGQYDLVVTERNSTPYQSTLTSTGATDGFLELNQSIYAPGQEVKISLYDPNGSGNIIVQAEAPGETPVSVTLSEDTDEEDLFVGSLQLAREGSASSVQLAVAHSETLTHHSPWQRNRHRPY